MDDDDSETIPLHNVDAATLTKVISWCDHHKEDLQPQSGSEDNLDQLVDDIPEWDADFLQVDQSTLFKLILAANYLDIKGLLEYTCKTVANMIKSKSTEEIKRIFSIKNDFNLTDEEKMG